VIDMQVSVFGLGYVGCVTAACLARAGHRVIGVDVSREKVEMINRGATPVLEPGLDELLSQVVSAGALSATDSAAEAVRLTDLALICVGTPGRANGQLDTTAVERVGEEIGRALRRRGHYTVVLRSTTLPGTAAGRLAPAVARGAGREPGGWLGLAVNPEFMREGSSLEDFAHPAFTLVGTDDDAAADAVRRLYAATEAPFVRTSLRSAEMVKYTANAFHALKICFANEIGDFCQALGADAEEVMRVFLMDRKLNVSEAYLRPGFAFGGSCLPKDLRALVHSGQAADLASVLLSAILPSNDAQLRRGVNLVLDTKRRRIGVVGLAFKHGTDDLRESPMVTLVETLVGKGCDVRILDQNVAVARLQGANKDYIEAEIPHVAALMCDDVEALLEHAEVIVIGSGGPAAATAAAGARPDQIVIDLTRRAAPGRRSKGAWAAPSE